MFSTSDPAHVARGFIKVCGICNLEDAALCSALGVDAVGMLLTKPGVPRKEHSDRLDPEEAASLAASLSRGLRSVLLVHTVDLDEILSLAERIAPDALQVQVPVGPDALRRVKEREPRRSIIKSFSVAPGKTVAAVMEEIRTYRDCGSIDAVLLDSARGGSGHVHDWSISAEVVDRLRGTPVLIAGGLTAANVAAARAAVRPYGVDVMSGVNSSARDRKDPERLRAFVQAWRGGQAGDE